MKERDVVFAPEARDDLSDLYRYVATASHPNTALAYLERVERFCLGLSVGSERGSVRSDIREGLRVVGFERSLSIAFTVAADRVEILRVFYGGRDWRSELE